jgi:hypothetical protein
VIAVRFYKFQNSEPSVFPARQVFPFWIISAPRIMPVDKSVGLSLHPSVLFFVCRGNWCGSATATLTQSNRNADGDGLSGTAECGKVELFRSVQATPSFLFQKVRSFRRALRGKFPFLSSHAVGVL